MALNIATDAFSRFDRLTFVGRRVAQAGLGGEHRSRHRASSTDFVDYRPYQPGDDFRRVDWNVYGRLGSLQVKLTEARERLDVTLVLDCSASMALGQPDKLTFAAQLVAALAYVGVARSDAVRLLCLSAKASRGLGPLHGRAQFSSVVRYLNQVEPGGCVELNEALATCLPVADGAQRLVILVSDLLTPSGMAQGLDELLTHRADVAVIQVLSPDELAPRLTGEVELIDSETGERLELGASLATLEAYRTRFRQWLDQQQADCTSRGVRFVSARTDRPVASVVLEDLRAARVLR